MIHCIILAIFISHLHHNAYSSIDLDCCRFESYPKMYLYNSWGVDVVVRYPGDTGIKWERCRIDPITSDKSPTGPCASLGGGRYIR
jgi:hypothetical protein